MRVGVFVFELKVGFYIRLILWCTSKIVLYHAQFFSTIGSISPAISNLIQWWKQTCLWFDTYLICAP